MRVNGAEDSGGREKGGMCERLKRGRIISLRWSGHGEVGKERKGVSLKVFYSRKEASWETHAEVHEYLSSCACLCV